MAGLHWCDSDHRLRPGDRAMRLSYRFEAEVFLPEYRLAPEHPFPAALDDAVAAYDYDELLLDDARAPRRLLAAFRNRCTASGRRADAA